MTPKRTREEIYTSDKEDETPALKRLRESEKAKPNVVVRMGNEYFIVRLLSLVTESSYFRTLVDTTFSSLYQNKSDAVIVVPPADLPCKISPEVSRIVINSCRGQLPESEISAANVVDLIVTSLFLGMQNLTSKASKFLDDVALSTRDGCISVLCSFDANNLPTKRYLHEDIVLIPTAPMEDNARGREELSKSIFHKLFKQSARAFVGKLEKLVTQCSMQSCDLTSFLQVAELLPQATADLIYEVIIAEQFGLSFTIDSMKVDLCQHLPSPNVWESVVRVRDDDLDINLMSRLTEHFQSVFPDRQKSFVAILNIVKLMMRPKEDSVGNTTVVNFDFLCAVLVELRRSCRRNEDPHHELSEQMGLQPVLQQMSFLRMSVVAFFRDCQITTIVSKQQKIEFQLAKFDDGTLSSIVRAAENFEDEKRVSTVLEIVDNCFLSLLEDSSFTVDQVLMIYERAASQKRPSHDPMYNVFKASLGRKAISQSEILRLSKILDSNKLSPDVVERFWDDIVERFWEEFLKLFEQTRLHEKVVKMRERRRNQELVQLRSDVDTISQANRQAESELLQLRAEFETTSREKKQVESDLLQLRRELQTGLSGMKAEPEMTSRGKEQVESKLLQLRRELQTGRSGEAEPETTSRGKKKLETELETTSRGKKKLKAELEMTSRGKKKLETELETTSRGGKLKTELETTSRGQSRLRARS